MTQIRQMDEQTGIFDKIKTAVSAGTGTHSSDFDLNPAVQAKLPKNRKLRPASVLIPLIGRPKGIQVILTRRSGNLLHHPGQVAFRGGKVDAADISAEYAALREAKEEIGLPPQNVEILGKIGIHETVTQFSIIPFLGKVHTNFTPVPEPGEVDEVFEVPLLFLLDPQNFQVHSRTWLGEQRSYLAIPYGPHFIWGATARILKGLSDRLAEI